MPRRVSPRPSAPLMAAAVLLASALSLTGCGREPPGDLAEPPRAPRAATDPAVGFAERHGAGKDRSGRAVSVYPSPVRLDEILVRPKVHRLETTPDDTLREIIRGNLAALGPISVGRANRGHQLNAIQFPEGAHWEVTEPGLAWGMPVTIDSSIHAIRRVVHEHAGSPRLFIGHVSRKRGGWLRPHRSHQSGRDIDLGYYYQDGPSWYQKATAETLDTPRTWTLLLGLLELGTVEYVFMDRSIQLLLVEHARTLGYDDDWLHCVFEKLEATGPKNPEAVVRHRWGHATHLHVRFFADEARETYERTASLLRRFGKI